MKLTRQVSSNSGLASIGQVARDSGETMTVEERNREVDAVISRATVSLANLSAEEAKLLNDLCKHFELPRGTLLRRAAAIELVGGAETVSDRLREAAQHLVYR